MEIVSIEKKTFEMMLASFNALSEKVAALRRKSDGGRLERCKVQGYHHAFVK